MFVLCLNVTMNGLGYGAEGAAEALKERIGINNGELDGLRGLQKSAKYRIDNSNDENEIKEFKHDIEKHDVQISILENYSSKCMKEIMKIEERMGT